jgi:hypothetical protein
VLEIQIQSTGFFRDFEGKGRLPDLPGTKHGNGGKLREQILGPGLKKSLKHPCNHG